MAIDTSDWPRCEQLDCNEAAACGAHLCRPHWDAMIAERDAKELAAEHRLAKAQAEEHAACLELAKYGTLRSVLYDDTLPDDFELHYGAMLDATRKVTEVQK